MALIFKDVDPLDIDDALKAVERSFNIKFVQEDLERLKTFGELTDVIIAKINAVEGGGCTTQQAFYKLRSAISQMHVADDISLKRDTPLKLIFPRKDRRVKIAQLESVLGFKPKVLIPSGTTELTMAVLLLVSFGYLFIDWIYGLLGMVMSLLIMYIVRKTTRHLSVRTLGELAEKIQKENYLKVRRNPATINRDEIYPIVESIFNEQICLDKGVLHKDASLV